jgi:hypothetical protein
MPGFSFLRIGFSQLITLIFFVCCSLGCGSTESQTRTEIYTGAWDPGQVTLTCLDSSRCPDHQGVIIGYFPSANGYTISSCSGSLYEPRRVLSAHHCNMADAKEVYFFAVPKLGQPQRRSRIRFETGDKGPNHDHASFVLQNSFVDRSFVRPVEQIPPRFDDMAALVVNALGSLRYRFEVLSCRHVPNGVSQITVELNPFWFVLQDCTTVKGNSGGAVVDPNNLNLVYGIISSGPIQNITFTKAVRRIERYGLSDWTTVANVRCFALPGWPRKADSCE